MISKSLTSSGLGKVVCVCGFLFIFVGQPRDAEAISCPNMPSGAATLSTIHFDTSDGEGQLWEIYPGAGQIQQPSGAEGNASASILASNATTGGQQTIWPKPGNQQPLNNTYVCFRWKMNSTFVGIRTANKVVFLAAQDFRFGREAVNGFFGVKPLDTSGYPGTAQPMFWFFGHNSGGWDNSHACSLDYGLQCNPNVTTTSLSPDTWYTIEIYIISSTCKTCLNGTVKWWVNGTLNGNYTNLNYGDTIVNQFQINHTWDGSTALQCGPPDNPSNPLGRYCPNPQIHYFDELMVASVGGAPPSSAPTAPSNLRFDSSAIPLSPSNLRFDSSSLPDAPSNLRFGP